MDSMAGQAGSLSRPGAAVGQGRRGGTVCVLLGGDRERSRRDLTRSLGLVFSLSPSTSSSRPNQCIALDCPPTDCLRHRLSNSILPPTSPNHRHRLLATSSAPTEPSPEHCPRTLPGPPILGAAWRRFVMGEWQRQATTTMPNMWSGLCANWSRKSGFDGNRGASITRYILGPWC